MEWQDFDGVAGVWVKEDLCDVCAPQVGRNLREKREFREKVEELLQLMEEDEILCLAGDFNAQSDSG